MDADISASLQKRFPMKKLPNGNILTMPVRVSFPHLVKPRVGDDGSEKFEVTLLFPLGADLQILNESLLAAGVEEYGANVLDLVRADKVRWPIKDQSKAVDSKTSQPFPGMVAGAKLCTARTANDVGVIDALCNKADPKTIYPGCWARVTIHTWAKAYVKNGEVKSRNISVGLNNVQFVADDERLGGGGNTNPHDEFEPIDGTAGAASAFAGSGAGGGKFDFA